MASKWLCPVTPSGLKGYRIQEYCLKMWCDLKVPHESGKRAKLNSSSARVARLQELKHAQFEPAAADLTF